TLAVHDHGLTAPQPPPFPARRYEHRGPGRELCTRFAREVCERSGRSGHLRKLSDAVPSQRDARRRDDDEEADDQNVVEPRPPPATGADSVAWTVFTTLPAACREDHQQGGPASDQ